MCRTHGSLAKKTCWSIVVELNGSVVKSAEYTSLLAASEDLGISKHILYNIKAGKVKYAQRDSCILPKITICKIKRTETQIQN